MRLARKENEENAQLITKACEMNGRIRNRAVPRLVLYGRDSASR